MNGPVRFGFAPAHGAADAARAGRSLAAYLSARAGVEVKPFVASSYGTLVKGLAEEWVDIGWLPPLVYVMASLEKPATPLAKFERLGRGSYHGAFIVRADSQFHKLADLRGMRMAYSDPRSSAGYLFPRTYLKSQGLEPDALFANQAFLGSHRRVVEAVLDRRADVGATFFSPLAGREPGATAWTQHFPTRAHELRVLAQTAAIPSDVIAARHGCPPEVQQRVREAFLKMADEPAGRELLSRIFNAERAVAASRSDYAELEHLARAQKTRWPQKTP